MLDCPKHACLCLKYPNIHISFSQTPKGTLLFVSNKQKPRLNQSRLHVLRRLAAHNLQARRRHVLQRVLVHYTSRHSRWNTVDGEALQQVESVVADHDLLQRAVRQLQRLHVVEGGVAVDASDLQ